MCGRTIGERANEAMLRLCRLSCRFIRRSRLLLLRRAYSSPSCSPRSPIADSETQTCLRYSQRESPPPGLLHNNCDQHAGVPFSVPLLSKTSLIAVVSAAAAIIASYSVASSKDGLGLQNGVKFGTISSEVEGVVGKSNEWVTRIANRMKQTGAAASVLWHSMRSVMSSANHEVRAGFELRVATLLADIVAASDSRRAAIVSAGGGAVVDWLLETIAVPKDGNGAQAESARALACLIADPNVSEAVLGRPQAVPNLLRFILSAQPRRSNNQSRRSPFNVCDKSKSMLVTAIMDVVTSNCNNAEKLSFKPLLPKNAEIRDVAAAIKVMEDGDLHWDEYDNEGGKGMKGIGIKVLGGTTTLGLSGTNVFAEVNQYDFYNAKTANKVPRSLLFNKMNERLTAKVELSSAVVPGPLDCLHSEHVAVPFAAWALANWASASEVNRSHIHELDQDGHAVVNALMAPERSVKWHGSRLARLLLEDQNLPLNGSVSGWSSSLLSTISQASNTQDIPLAQVSLSALLVSLKRSQEAQGIVMDKGCHSMREVAEQSGKHKSIQESLAKALELISSSGLHMSLEESQKWAAILLSWIFGEVPSDTTRSSAIRILSRILEDYGPSSIPISQGWLTILLTDSLKCRKETLKKESSQFTNDKVKTQIDLLNVASASRTARQMANAVVNLAGALAGPAIGSSDSFPLAGLLSLEPFAGALKNVKKDKKPKIAAADSAYASLKGIKALTEISAEDPLVQQKIADLGVLCLLKRLLLEDDYEQLAALEAYELSRALESQDKVPSNHHDSSVGDTHDHPKLQVPPIARIRRNAARLLTILSGLPKVKEAIVVDNSLLNWLEECANGQIPGCNDVKIRSYARATLLNAHCCDSASLNSENVGDGSSNCLENHCHRYNDIIFIINPELPHWKCTKQKLSVDNLQTDGDFSERENRTSLRTLEDDQCPASTSGSESLPKIPPLDVVFVHGLQGSPFKTWRLSEDKSSTKSGLVEKIDEEAGKRGTFWPGEWLGADFPHARIFSLKYKTNLTQWSGASLPLQEVSSMLLDKLVAAGIGDRPVVFVTHSMGGLVVKQMLHQADAGKRESFVNNAIGIVFYSCPHFGSKLADMPWHMGLVLRPAPTIGELRSGSPRLMELNEFLHQRYKENLIDVRSFCETKVTPIVEAYGGWALRMKIVPMESAYPGFGELIVLDSTDHVNSCKPLSKADPSYKDTLDFLQKLKSQYSR